MRNLIHFREFAVAAIGMLIMGSAIGANEHHSHHDSNERKTQQVAKPTKKWETDEVLRQGMDNIRQAFMNNQAAIRQDRLTPQEYKQLAETIEKNLGEIVKNSKLAPQADAALHAIVLTDLIGSSKFMSTAKKRSIQRANTLGVLQSLRLYGGYFDHPGWEIDGTKAY
jgi:hypothetical protein